MNELDKKTERLLLDGWVSPPSDFVDTVTQNIFDFEHEHERFEKYDQISPVIFQATPWWQWIALTAGSVIGVGQVMRFIFSVWFVTAVG